MTTEGKLNYFSKNNGCSFLCVLMVHLISSGWISVFVTAVSQSSGCTFCHSSLSKSSGCSFPCSGWISINVVTAVLLSSGCGFQCVAPIHFISKGMYSFPCILNICFIRNGCVLSNCHCSFNK